MRLSRASRRVSGARLYQGPIGFIWFNGCVVFLQGFFMPGEWGLGFCKMVELEP